MNFECFVCNEIVYEDDIIIKCKDDKAGQIIFMCRKCHQEEKERNNHICGG